MSSDLQIITPVRLLNTKYIMSNDKLELSSNLTSFWHLGFVICHLVIPLIFFESEKLNLVCSKDQKMKRNSDHATKTLENHQ